MSEQPWEAAMLGDPQRIELMRARIEADEALMKDALSALEESVDIVGEDYRTDWRHGLPTRKAQLDVKKEQLDAHDAAITALRSRLETK